MLLLALPVLSAQRGAGELAVLYPDAPDPYSRVFKDIISGIREAYPGKVREHLVERNASVPQIELWLEKKQLTELVALGKDAMNLSQQLPNTYLTVSGAVLAAPPVVSDAFTAITLAPDPDLMFRELKKLAPWIKVIHVIYGEVLHARLILRALEVASSHGVQIKSYTAGDVSDIANLYRSFFNTLDAKTEAVWLLQGDAGLRERSVLYHVLKEAWNNNILVFSSNPSYVSKGALFALYPDNRRMGKALANKILARKAGEIPTIEQTRDLLIAVNIRTAEHLGLNISRSWRREFDMVFPRQ